MIPGCAIRRNFRSTSPSLTPRRRELLIEEEYICDANGDVEVKIHDKITQQTNEYRLGRWSKHRKKLKTR